MFLGYALIRGRRKAGNRGKKGAPERRFHGSEPMGRPTFVTVEAELRAPGVIVQVGSYDWDQPLEVMEHNTIPSITLLLSPPHSYSEACFSRERGAGKFVDVGDVIFAPADLHL